MFEWGYGEEEMIFLCLCFGACVLRKGGNNETVQVVVFPPPFFSLILLLLTLGPFPSSPGLLLPTYLYLPSPPPFFTLGLWRSAFWAKELVSVSYCRS